MGNIRLSYSDKDKDGKIDLVRNGTDIDNDGDYVQEIVEENNYYPFGLKHEGYNNTIRGRKHPHGFNGIEYTEDLGLNLYEMDLRKYDPAIARWTSIDPVTHYSLSPYNAFDNNPIVFSDPSGADSEDCCDTDVVNPNDPEDLGLLIINGDRNLLYGGPSDYYGDLNAYREDFGFHGDYDQVFSDYIQRYGNSYVPVALRNDLNTIDASGFAENFAAGHKNWDSDGLGNFLMKTTSFLIGSTLTLPFSSVAGAGASTAINSAKFGTSSYAVSKTIFASKATAQVVNTGIQTAVKEKSVIIYRNFGWNELNSIKNLGGKFSIHPNNFQGKQFWIGESGLNNWVSKPTFSKPFTAQLSIPESYITPSSNNFLFLEKNLIIDGFPGGTVLPSNLDKFNSVININWIKF